MGLEFVWGEWGRNNVQAKQNTKLREQPMAYQKIKPGVERQKDDSLEKSIPKKPMLISTCGLHCLDVGEQLMTWCAARSPPKSIKSLANVVGSRSLVDVVGWSC